MMLGVQDLRAAFLVVVLLAVYRAPLLALVPLVTIGMSVWVALSGLAPGQHIISVQVFDRYENTTAAKVMFTVPGRAAR